MAGPKVAVRVLVGLAALTVVATLVLALSIAQPADAVVLSNYMARDECMHPDHDCKGFQDIKYIFIGIGCQKCGSTSLYATLSGLSSVFVYDSKEMHFFDGYGSDAINSTLYFEYLRPWGLISHPEPWVPFELSPAYMFDRFAPYNMRKLFDGNEDKVRFIAILRDPVERAYSGFFQSSRGLKARDFVPYINADLRASTACYRDAFYIPAQGECPDPHLQYARARACRESKLDDNKPWFSPLPTDVQEASMEDPLFRMYESILTRGIYVDQLKNFLCAGWKPSQFLITSVREFRNDIKGLTHRIAKFLDISYGYSGYRGKLLAKNKAAHVGSKAKSKPLMAEDTINRLRKFYEPYNERLIHFLHTNGFTVNFDYLEEEIMGQHGRLQSQEEKDRKVGIKRERDLGSGDFSNSGKEAQETSASESQREGNNDDDDDDDNDDNGGNGRSNMVRSAQVRAQLHDKPPSGFSLEEHLHKIEERL